MKRQQNRGFDISRVNEIINEGIIYNENLSMRLRAWSGANWREEEG